MGLFLFPLREFLYPLLSDSLDVQSFITFFCISLELLELNYEEREPFNRRSRFSANINSDNEIKRKKITDGRCKIVTGNNIATMSKDAG